MPREIKPNEFASRWGPKGCPRDPYAVRTVGEIHRELQRRGIQISRSRVGQLLESATRKIRRELCWEGRDL